MSEDVRTILLYSSNRLTRENVRLALGRKVAGDLPVSVVEVATQPAVISAMDQGGVDLAILDGEAVPGGMGLCRQLKDEIVRCPPILVLTGRIDDAWLATWTRAGSTWPSWTARPCRAASGSAVSSRTRCSTVRRCWC